MREIRIEKADAPRRRRSSGPIHSGGRPTMYDVAALAGVSQMTVSRVVNGGKASERTKAAVARAIEELGYRPNEAARALAASKVSQASGPAQTGRVPGSAFDLLWTPYSDFLSEMLKPRH